MANPQVVWYGTQQESFDLINAIARHCTCEFGTMGVRLSTCPPHRMLMEEQRSLNGLLFARHMADRLRREEGLMGGAEADNLRSFERAREERSSRTGLRKAG